MNNQEVKSAIMTVESLQRLAFNIHGVMDIVDCENIEKIKAALEKQIPKKPIRVSNNRTDGCPICKTEYYERFKHCPECGIKLDWSVESFEI